jgi:tellurite resistance protein TerC
MGLRQLYFLLHGLFEKLVYLNRGLAVILLFIGVKLLLEAITSTTSLALPRIPIAVSLGFIAAVLVITAVTSLIAVRRHPELMEGAPEVRAEQQAEAERGVALRDLPEEGETREAR